MNKVKILVVEDAVITADSIKRSLENSGYMVPAIMASGEDAIKKVEEHKPDLILMDIILKGKIDGIETANIIHSRFDLPIVYLSDFTDKKTLERAKRTEPFGYLTKPFKDKELLSTIEMAVYKHRMEKKLKEKEQFLQTILKSMGEGIIVLDKNFRIQMANRVTLDFLKRKEEEVIGNYCYRLIHRKDKPCTDCTAAETFRTGKPASVCRSGIGEDGSKTYVELSSFPIFNSEGWVIQVIEKAVDVSMRTHEKEILQNIATGVSSKIGEDFFSSLVCYLAKTLDMKYALIAKLLPKDKEILQTIAICDHNRIVENFEYHLENTPCEKIIKRGLCVYPQGVADKFPKDTMLKEMGVVSYVGAPLVNSAGRICGLIAIMDCKPISNLEIVKSMIKVFADRAVAELERIEVENALRESEERLQSIIDNTTALIYLKDIKGKYILINHQYETIFRIGKDEIAGKTDKDIFPKDIAKAFQHNDRKVLEKGGPIEFEEYAHHDDGIHSYISIKFPLFDSSGKIYGVCSISTDITERKKAETTLKQFSQKLVESQELERKRIASDLHDGLAQNMMIIKNEIHKIISNSPKKKDRESLNLVSSLALQSIDDIDRIVNDLHPHQLDHLGLTKAIKWLAKKISKSSGINILTKINVMPEVIPSATEIHIYRIIQEGINNIVKHSIASKGRIELKGLNEHIDIMISDDGKGFEYNSKYAKNTVHKGFGLQGIEERAKMCGGILTIDSSSRKGTTLKITIPVKRKGK